MGLDSGDRDVYRKYIDDDDCAPASSGSSTAWRSSKESEEELGSTDGDPAMLPKDRTLVCAAETPIVVGTDGTGSMGGSAKVVHDKRPLLWGQMEQHGYVKDPAMSIAVVGDHTSDRWPFQVGDFENTPTEIDKWMRRCYLEGGGGGGREESYLELLYYYATGVKYRHPKPRKGYLFLIGDEGPRDAVYPSVAKRHFGQPLEERLPAEDVIKLLTERYHVYMLQVPYSGGRDSDADKQISAEWRKVLPQSLIFVKEPNSVVDIMLGIIARSEGVRTLDGYDEDMKDRKQSAERRRNVREALSSCTALASASAAVSSLPMVVKGRNRTGGSKRMKGD